MPFRFDQPEYLWLLLLAVPILWLGRRSLAALEPARRRTATALRLGVLLLLVLILAGFEAVRWHEELSVVAVLDESESVRRFAKPPTDAPSPTGEPWTVEQWTRYWLSQGKDQGQREDRLGLVSFDGRPTVEAMPSMRPSLDSATVQSPEAGTDAAAALRLGMAMFPADSSKRLLLVSDGNDTVGGEEALLSAAAEARAAGVPVDVLPLEYEAPEEAMVEAVYAPREARAGQTIALRVVLSATSPTAGVVQVLHDGEVVDLAPGDEATGAPISPGEWTPRQEGAGYICVRTLELPELPGGPNQFEAVFEPAAGSDAIAVNNRASSFTLVHGQGRVLVVDTLGETEGSFLPDVLNRHGIRAERTSAAGLPTKLSGLNRYEAIILHNVPAELVPPRQQQMLTSYVNDLGGGLVMIGGPDGFGAGGWANSPIDRILPVESQIPSQTVLPAGALVFVIDRSGSMASPVAGTNVSQQEIANEAAALALQGMFPQDMVGVIAFDNSPQWVVPLARNDNPQLAAKAISAIQPSGGTSIYPALVEAQSALATKAGDAAVKHIILLTDGQSQGGDYYKIVRSMVQENMTLSTVGIGDGVDAQLLSQLATMGNGSFHPVQNPKDLPRIFIREARTIRKQLIKETPFVPTLVQSGSPIVSGMDSTPELKGLVLTAPKRDPRVFTPLLGKDGEPLLAHWQVGLGRVVAFTSDATSRWAADWLRWPGYADFWARTVRHVSRTTASGGYHLSSNLEHGKLRLKLDASEANVAGSRFANFLTVQGNVIQPDGSLAQVTLEQTGPGVYEATLPANQEGNYIVSLLTKNSEGNTQAVFGGASQPPGPELRSFTSNRALLERVAQMTGGRVLSPTEADAASVFDRQTVVPSRSIRPMWHALLPWLLGLFLLDVACRRIAWDVGGARRWWQDRRAAAARARARTDEAASTLSALKKKAGRVDEQLNRSQDAKEAKPAAAGAPSPDTKRKFEAGAGAKASADFAEAVGGAKAGQAPKLKRNEPKKADPEAGTTSRLLDAKRRARQNLREEEES